jgi:multidrug efflux pump subunit AcrA (membrane-fusion protein)
MEGKLIPYGTVTPNSVVMTVVKDRPMYVETNIGEKDLPTVEAGQSVTIVPASDDDVELAGSVEQVADVPGGGNKFPVKVVMKGEKAPDWLMPGMTAKARIETYSVEDAVVIPADLVQSDEENPKKKYVMVQLEDEDEPVRREIKLGKSKDKNVEVLKGLKAGDLVVKGAEDKPGDDAKTSDEKKDDEKK